MTNSSRPPRGGVGTTVDDRVTAVWSPVESVPLLPKRQAARAGGGGGPFGSSTALSATSSRLA